MSNPSPLVAIAGALLLSLGATSAVRADYVDPSERVARLSHSQGEVSYSPAGEDEWLGVERNRPLSTGDRLWTDRRSVAELQIGSTALRLGPDTSLEILDLDDRIAQVEVTQGSVNLRVRRMYRGQVYEVDTPTLAFTISRPGRYRIDVDPRDDQTTIVVWEGAGEAYGDRSHFPLRAGDTVRFYGSDLRDHEVYGLPREDEFDRYSLDRDRRLDRSGSLRYVGDDMVGYSDLDEYGSWRAVPTYGNVWFPSRVDANWAPYRDGRWIWQEPWGWTWVDSAPWGFAPSHYGRWAYMSNRWGWIPGPRNVRPVYAPALVAFIGGHGWSLSLSFGDRSPIGWFPLGPREPYVPSYQASRDYFTRVNVNNTVINNTTITNVYNNYYSSGNINAPQVNYVNRRVGGAVTAVPANAFAGSQPVRPAALRLDANAATSGEVTRIARIAPSARSVLGAGPAATVRPSRAALDRRVVARNVPPPHTVPFAERAPQLQRNPGRPLEPRAADSARARPADTQPSVRVIKVAPDAVDARAAGPSRSGGKAAAPAGGAGPPPPLDRSAPTQRGREPVEGAPGVGPKKQGEAKQPPASTEQADRAAQSERDAQAADQAKKREAQSQRDAQAAQQSQRDAQAADQAKKREAQSQRDAQAAQQSQRDAQAADQAKKREAQSQRDAQAAQQSQRDAQAAQQSQRDAQAAERASPAGQGPPAAQAATPTQGQVKPKCEGLSPEETVKCEARVKSRCEGLSPEETVKCEARVKSRCDGLSPEEKVKCESKEQNNNKGNKDNPGSPK